METSGKRLHKDLILSAVYYEVQIEEQPVLCVSVTSPCSVMCANGDFSHPAAVTARQKNCHDLKVQSLKPLVKKKKSLNLPELGQHFPEDGAPIEQMDHVSPSVTLWSPGFPRATENHH